MPKKIKLDNLNATRNLARQLWHEIKNDRERSTILLEGELGSGKTTFSQYFLQAAGAAGPFASPTFVIMKEYFLPSPSNKTNKNPRNSLVMHSNIISPAKIRKKRIYHFDCYRVSPANILDLGWEELINNQENVLLVEWAEKIQKIWPKKYYRLIFRHQSSTPKPFQNSTRSVLMEQR